MKPLDVIMITTITRKHSCGSHSVNMYDRYETCAFLRIQGVKYFWVPNRRSDPNNCTGLQNPLKLISVQTQISVQGCKTDQTVHSDPQQTLHSDLATLYFLNRYSKCVYRICVRLRNILNTWFQFKLYWQICVYSEFSYVKNK